MRALIVAILVIVGIIAIVVGVFYIVDQAHNLPSFFPGHVALPKGHGKHTKRGIAALVIGVVLLVVAAVVGMTGRRSYRH